MKLSKIEILNFKGLREAQFCPTRFACLVGENNAGKSSLLQSIVFGLNRPPQLGLDQFYDQASPIKFTLYFEGIEAGDLLRLVLDHRTRISDIVDNGRLTIVVTYPPGGKVEVTTLRPVPLEIRYRADAISEVLKGKRGGAIRQVVVDEYPEFAAEAGNLGTIGDAKAFLQEKIDGLGPEQFEIAEVPLPSGISSSISNLLPEPIYIPAVRNLGDEMKTSQSTSFGRLLALLLDDLGPDLDQINQTFQELNALLNRTIEDGEVIDERHAKVREMEVLVEGFLREHFANASIEFKIPPPELKTILSSAQIYVDDGSHDLIDNKGDGIKRSMTFALLRSYVEFLEIRRIARVDFDVEAGEAVLPRPIMFLFEEPELYLHPRSQKILFGALSRISRSYQVVVTTHSPLFFAPGVTASFVRLAKENAEPKPVGKLFPIDFALDVVSAETFRMARFDNADAAFFSARVVLFEGESDDSYIKHVARKLNEEWDFENKNIALVRVSGKGNFAKYRKFFEAFGVQVYVVADLDAFFEGYQHLGAPEGLGELRNAAIALVDARINAIGILSEPKTRQIRDKTQQQTFRERYNAAKEALRGVQRDRVVNEEILQAIDGLFTWEDDIGRVKACGEDEEARRALVPILDALRQHGICVLSRGAIEDYYPEGASISGPKPTRAIEACDLIQNAGDATALSDPLEPGRDPELTEILQKIFD